MENEIVNVVYVCPECRSILSNAGKFYYCPTCNKKFPFIDDIPIFSKKDIYYGEVNRLEMAELIENSKKIGYRKAISKMIKDPFVLTYILDENRALWGDLLALKSHTNFLDVGCGWGTTTIPLARMVGHVAAIDNTLERVKFVDLRANEDGLSNITPALASATALPYPDEYFDVVAFNGVLEWLGAIDEKKAPSKIQLEALNEAFRVLKSGGRIYIGIENRFSLRYFLGDPDDHSFIRFTSLMPRWMSQIYYKLRTGKNYFMYTHSLSAYRRMLGTIGFTRVTIYYPWPNYRNPEKFVELTKNSILAHINNEIMQAPAFSRKRIYLKLLGFLTRIEGRGSFCHSFSFICEK